MQLRTSDVSAQRLDDEIIVLNLVTSRYFSVTGVGIDIFDMLREPRDLDGVVEQLVSKYSVDADTARADAESFIEELRRRDLLDEG